MQLPSRTLTAQIYRATERDRDPEGLMMIDLAPLSFDFRAWQEIRETEIAAVIGCAGKAFGPAIQIGDLCSTRGDRHRSIFLPIAQRRDR